MQWCRRRIGDAILSRIVLPSQWGESALRLPCCDERRLGCHCGIWREPRDGKRWWGVGLLALKRRLRPDRVAVVRMALVVISTSCSRVYDTFCLCLEWRLRLHLCRTKVIIVCKHYRSMWNQHCS
jgi:hypothetical protein